MKRIKSWFMKVRYIKGHRVMLVPKWGMGINYRLFETCLHLGYLTITRFHR